MKQLYKKIGSYLILCIASVCFLLPFLSDDLQLPVMAISVRGTDHSGNRSLGKYLLHPVSHRVSEISGFTLRYTIIQTLLTLLICGLAGF